MIDQWWECHWKQERHWVTLLVQNEAHLQNGTRNEAHLIKWHWKLRQRFSSDVPAARLIKSGHWLLYVVGVAPSCNGQKKVWLGGARTVNLVTSTLPTGSPTDPVHCLAGWTISREGWRPWINSMELTFFPIFLWRFPRGGVLVEPEGEYRALPRGTMCVNHVNHVNHINHVNHVCQPDLSLDSTDFHLIIPPLIKTYFQMIKGGDYLWMRSEWWARIIIQQKGCDGQFGLLPRRCVNLLLHSLCSVA